MSVKRIGIALILIGFLSTIGWFTPEPAHACSCMRPDVEASLESSSEVFLGSVVAIEEVYDPHESPGTIGRRNVVLFEVERSYKHEVPSQIIVYAGLDETSCGYDFAVGRNYFILRFVRGRSLPTLQETIWQSLGKGSSPMKPLISDPK
jgi:hypothetical protein